MSPKSGGVGDNMRTKLIVAMWTIISVATAWAGQKKSTFDRRKVVLRAMVQEMNRSLKTLKMPGFDLPYFIAYEMKESESSHIKARFGSIYKSSTDRSRRLRVECRVGNYEFDNIGSKKRDYGFSFSPGFRSSVSGPLDNDPQALRNSLWLMTDQQYKGALKAFLKRKSKQVTEVDKKEDEQTDSFSKEKPAAHTVRHRPFSFDRDHWERMARSASAIFENHPHIFDSYVTLDGNNLTRYFVNSEGSRIITEFTMYSISISGTTRAPDGMLLRSRSTTYALEESGLPGKEQIMKEVRELITNLEALRKAPVLEPYTGPAILDGEATGVLFHEVIGHRLEGERQLDEEEGKTYKGQMGNKIIPEFLSVVDDPTRKDIDGITLNGFYRFDDEGVKAQRVVLVEKGILKGFLTSRTPVKGFPKSNGHGRSSPGEKPRARMGNTIIESNRTVPFAKLKEMLIEEVKKQDKPYGLIIKNIVGGSTHTSTWGYQAYKGIPELVYRVFPDGREELVRGVEIVGTPIASINKITTTSDRTAVFNGYCGAESGYVPVSAVAPDVLMTEIELQRSMKKAEKGPVLPSPWTGPTKP
jgi:predicted Zn-dependent protease